MSYWRFQALSELNDLIKGKAPADQIERIDIDMPEAAYGHGGSQAVRPLEPIGAQMNVVYAVAVAPTFPLGRLRALSSLASHRSAA